MSRRVTIRVSWPRQLESRRGRALRLASIGRSDDLRRRGDQGQPLAQMSARELEILRLWGRGDRISEVASELGISYKTVANTTSTLKTKLGAKNHSDLVRIAVEIDLH